MNKGNVFKILIVGLLVAAIAGGFYVMKYSSGKDVADSTTGAIIEVSPMIYNFGVIKYGEKGSKNFEIKNIGNETLQLLKISTSCGCTKAEVENDAKTVEPGKSVKMTVIIDPAVHNSYADVGDIKRMVYLDTNDKKSPEYEVEVNAMVVKPDKNETIEIIAEGWKFIPNEINAKEGEYVELKMKSNDYKYDFNLPQFGISKSFEPGKDADVVFLADKKGTFPFACDLCAGHDTTGNLIVQ